MVHAQIQEIHGRPKEMALEESERNQMAVSHHHVLELYDGCSHNRATCSVGWPQSSAISGRSTHRATVEIRARFH